jgi:membrane protease YdiL (CAAX protease family)
MSTSGILPASLQTKPLGKDGPIARHPLVAFFALAYLGAWLAVFPLILSKLGVIPLALPPEPFVLLGGLAGPLLAALVVTTITEGKAGVKKLLGSCVRGRVSLRWYAVALLGYFVALLLGGVVVFGTSLLKEFASHWPEALSFYLLALVLGAVIGGPIGEEPGWRGFALPRLQNIFGPLAGSIILGVVWGFWHLPAYFGGWLGVPLTISTLGSVITGTVASAIIMTWVYNNARSSVFLMILMHSASNASIAMGGKILPHNMPEWLHTVVFDGWLSSLIYTICALLVVLSTRGGLSYNSKLAR